MQGDASKIRDQLLDTLSKQQGILFFEPMLVGRISYCGRDILAPNSDPSIHGDDRGYVLVERWIASKTIAGNDKPKEGEGLSKIIIHQQSSPPVCLSSSKKPQKKNLTTLFPHLDLIYGCREAC